MDFDTSLTCAFHKTFVRDSEKGKTYFAAKIGCSKWTCEACSRRVLKPRWLHKLVNCLAVEKSVYVGQSEGTNEKVAIESQRWKKRILRANGRWIEIHQQTTKTEFDSHDSEVLLLSTVPLLGHCERFNLLAGADELKRLAEFLSAVIGLVDRSRCRPITMHRGYLKHEQPTAEQWLRKFKQIAKLEGVWSSVVEKSEAQAIRKRCRATSGADRRNFIGCRLPDGLEVIATDMAIDLPKADSYFVSDRADDWFSSGGWRPKESFYRPVDLWDASGQPIKSPSDLREIAKCIDVDFGPMHPIVDGSKLLDNPESPKILTERPAPNPNAQNFFGAILRDPQKKFCFENVRRSTLLSS